MICLMRVFTYGADLFEAFDEKFYQKKNIRTRNTARTGIVNMNAKTKQTEIHLFPGYIQCNMLLLSVWGTEETEYQQLSLQRKMLTCSTWLINKLLICCIICWMLPFAYSNMLWMCVYCSFFFHSCCGTTKEWGSKRMKNRKSTLFCKIVWFECFAGKTTVWNNNSNHSISHKMICNKL